MVFLGPLFNPWIYPIRMASIRDFLVNSVKSKRDEFVSSGEYLLINTHEHFLKLKIMNWPECYTTYKATIGHQLHELSSVSVLGQHG